jgi:ribosomal protein S18 acetylase RimI-like enzyme
MQLELSSLDEQRFGIRTVRAWDVGLTDLDTVDAFVEQENARLLIIRIPTDDLRAVQRLEESGAILTDTLVYYRQSLTQDLPADTGTISVRPIRAEEVKAASEVAAATFEGYFGHYHADPRLDRTACDEVYRSWARRSCTREAADEVLVGVDNDVVVGFATLRMNGPDEGEGVLFGVAPQAQGRGLYRSMMVHAMEWCRTQPATRMVVSTQVTNIAVQKVWVRLGFEPYRSYYTLHRWAS